MLLDLTSLRDATNSLAQGLPFYLQKEKEGEDIAILGQLETHNE